MPSGLMVVFTSEEIPREVKKLVAECLGLNEEEIKDNSLLTNDLGAESVDYLDLQFRVEKVFGLNSCNDLFGNARDAIKMGYTVQFIVDYVRRRLGESGKPV